MVPLERVNSPGDSWLEAVFHVIVHSEVAFNQVVEIFDDLGVVLVEESLEHCHTFKFIEVFFKFSV